MIKHEIGSKTPSYAAIIFRHTWYRFALMLPCFAYGILFIIRLCKDPNVDVLYSGFWFIIAINIAALICLAYTIRYFKHLHTLQKSYEEPMNEVLASCGKVIAGRHYFYPLFLLTFEKPAKIDYKDIIRINAYSCSNPKSHRKYFYIHIYTNNGKRYVLKSFHTHFIDFTWNENADGFTNWNDSVNLLLQFSHNAKFSPHSPEHDAIQQFFKNRKRSRKK